MLPCAVRLVDGGLLSLPVGPSRIQKQCAKYAHCIEEDMQARIFLAESGDVIIELPMRSLLYRARSKKFLRIGA